MTDALTESLVIVASLDVEPLKAEAARAKQILGNLAPEIAKSLTVSIPDVSPQISRTAAEVTKLAQSMTGLGATANEATKVATSLTNMDRATKAAADARAKLGIDSYLRSLRAEYDLMTLADSEREQYAARLKVEELAKRSGTSAATEQVAAAIQQVKANQELRTSLAEVAVAQARNAQTIVLDTAERSKALTELRADIEARNQLRTTELGKSAQDANADAVAREAAERQRLLDRLREDILARQGERDTVDRGIAELQGMAVAIRREGELIGLTSSERELAIARRRAESIAVAAGITDHQRYIDLIEREIRKNQELRAASSVAQNRGLGLANLVAVAGVVPGTGQLTQVVFQAQQGAVALEGMAEAAGASSAALGPIAAAGAGIALTAGYLAYAAKESAHLEEALRPVMARSTEFSDRVGELRTRIRDLAAETGRSQQELAQGLVAVVQAGVSGARQSVEFLKSAADAARATGESIPSAAGAIDSVLDVFNLKADRARELADLLLVGAREGETTFPRYAAAIQKAGVVTGELGIPLNEMAALLSTVSRRTGNVDQAATSLVNVMQRLTGATDPTRQRLLALGVDASAAALRTKGIVAVLDEIRTKVGDRKDILADLFGGQRLASTFFAAISDTDGARRSMDAITRSSGEVEAAVKRATTAGEEFAKAWGELRRRSGIDELGDGLVSLGARVAKFTADFLRDHDTLTGIALAVQGPLGLVALTEKLRGTPSAVDAAVDALTRLGQSDVSATKLGDATSAVARLNDQLKGYRDRLADLRAEQEKVATTPRQIVTRNLGHGESIDVDLTPTFSKEKLDEIADLEKLIAEAPRDFKKRAEQGLRATAATIPLTIPASYYFGPINVGTLRKQADSIVEQAKGVFSLEVGKAKFELLTTKLPSDGSSGSADPFQSDKLKRELEQTLFELQRSVPPLDIPANIVFARDRLQKTLATPALLKDFQSLDPETARAQEAVREFTQNRTQADQLHLDLQARVAKGAEQQRIQADLANVSIQRTILLLGLYGINVTQLERDFDALKRSQSDAFDANRAREIAQAAAQLANSVQETASQRLGLAQSQGDAVAASRLELELDRAKTQALRAASAQRIADLRAQAIINTEAASNLDAEIAGERERLALALRGLGVDRERATFERERAARFLLAEAQRGTLQGSDAQVADIRLSFARQVESLNDEARKSRDVAAERAVILDLYRRSADQQERLVRLTDQGGAVDRELGLLQQVSRTYDDQLATLTATQAVERARLELEFATSAELAKRRGTILALHELALRQRTLDLGISEANRTSAQIAEQELYNAAFTRTVNLLGRAAVGSREFGQELVHQLRLARTGADALTRGLRAGVDDMRRAFADDFSFGIQAATDQMRTFRDAGVSAFEDVLDGNKKLGEGINDFLVAQLKQARHSALEFGFNKLGTAVFGAPEGGAGGLFGGVIDKLLGKKAGEGAQVPEEILRGASKDFGAYVSQFGDYVRSIPAATFGPSAHAQIVPADFNGPLADNQVRAGGLPPGFVGPPAPGQSQAGVGDAIAGAASDTLKDGARVAGQLIADGALRGSLSLQAAGLSLLSSFGGKLGSTLGDKAGSAAATALGFAQGGRIAGRIIPPSIPFVHAADGHVARSRTLIDVAELPGLEELVAPLDRGRLPAHLDEHGDLRVRVRGAEIPVDVRGSGPTARGQRGIDARGLRAREDGARAVSPASRGAERASPVVHVGGVTVQGGDVHVTVHARDGRDAADQIAAQMPQIAKAIAADLERGVTRALKDAVRAASR